MHISALKQSNFLTRADVGAGILVTISNMTQENVAKAGAPEELRWCLHFQETEKPMVCNSTNGQIIAGICKSEETDNWVGNKIVLYDDPNVSFGGRLVGGIRVRAPRNQAPKPQAPTSTIKAQAQAKPVQMPPEPAMPTEPEPSDDVPF